MGLRQVRPLRPPTGNGLGGERGVVLSLAVGKKYQNFGPRSPAGTNTLNFSALYANREYSTLKYN